MTKSKTVDDYIAGYPDALQTQLQQVRTTIRRAAPDAAEGMSYGMPAYTLNGKPLVYFGGFKTHIGLYATPSGHDAFAAELAGYRHAKGSVQFPLDEPIPFDLIERMVAFRVRQTLEGGPAPQAPLQRPQQAMPDFVRLALDEAGLTAAYRARPPYQRNDYLSWINRAVREETRQKRLDQMLAELRHGDVYMKMAWQAKGTP